jgi:peroxiredoxin
MAVDAIMATSKQEGAMTIKVGDKLPPVALKAVTAEGVKDVKADELFAGKKAVLFALPGAFTPTCSAQHLPGYLTQADALKKKGIDLIACLSVNDAFVMGAWAKDKGVGDKVVMLADGNGDFTRAVGLELDGSRFGMGQRSQRYALVAEDGVVKHLAVEEPGKFEASKAETILGKL